MTRSNVLPRKKMHIALTKSYGWLLKNACIIHSCEYYQMSPPLYIINIEGHSYLWKQNIFLSYSYFVSWFVLWSGHVRHHVRSLSTYRSKSSSLSCVSHNIVLNQTILYNMTPIHPLQLKKYDVIWMNVLLHFMPCYIMLGKHKKDQPLFQRYDCRCIHIHQDVPLGVHHSHTRGYENSHSTSQFHNVWYQHLMDTFSTCTISCCNSQMD